MRAPLARPPLQFAQLVRHCPNDMFMNENGQHTVPPRHCSELAHNTAVFGVASQANGPKHTLLTLTPVASPQHT